MADFTAEKLAQRAFDFNLLTNQQLEEVWGALGTRDVPLEDFERLTVRKELLTNFQIERIKEGKRDGYYYGKYKLLYMVGSGTFARVYRAAHTLDDQVVAIKVLRQRYTDDDETRENFLREAKVVIPLRHINIVPIYEVNSEGMRPYMVMEFIEGSNLRDFVHARQKLGVLDSLRLIADVAAALEYGSTHGGITHRDLKLSNVLVTSLGRAKLVDFGLAAMESNNEGDSTFNPRSIDYAGLERITGVRRNDQRSDIYFAGVMLYHLLIGTSPLFETRDRTKRLSVQRYREIVPINQADRELPMYIVHLVNKAMELNVEKRYQNPSLLLSELRTAIKRYESGDMGMDETTVTPTESIQKQTTQQPESEGRNRTIMLIESKMELQDLLRERLKKRGYRVLVISHPDRGMSRFDDDPDVADCVIFSSAGLGEFAVETFNAFGENEVTKDIPAILLIDKRRKELLRQAKLANHRRALALPLKVRELRILLLKLLSETGIPQQ